MQMGPAVQIVERFSAAILAVPTFAVALVTASPAAADCTSSGGVTLCSQGDVRGSNTGAAAADVDLK